MDIPRLHPDTIEEVKQRADIVDVISEYVVLRQRGRDYVGLCPFHDEKTPSFSVSPGKQLYYCFGCGAGGNAFKFLMELGKQSFSDVVLELARRYQVPVQTLEPEQSQELQRQISLREQLYEILAVAANFYQNALWQPTGETALHYLQAERQLAAATIRQFQLGYAPGGWETLYRYLVEQKRYPVALVAEAGLIQLRKGGNGYYDRFRERLMVPIADSQGRIIAFGSRSLGTEEPKYLNSPETPLFEKGKTLFALEQAKKHIQAQDSAVVVEGYFDAIALHAAGLNNAVASLGTAFSQAQLRQLLRYTESKQVIFNFDGDGAGITATQRAIAEIEPLVNSGQVQLRILCLPVGKDADEFLKSRPDAAEIYRQLLDSAPLWFDWQVQQLLRDRDLQQAAQFQQVMPNLLKLLGKINERNLQAYYVNYCANLLSQGNAGLVSQYAQRLNYELRRPQLIADEKNNDRGTIINVSSLPERSIVTEAEATLLRIYLHYPEYRQEIIDNLEKKDLVFSILHHRLLWQKIVELKYFIEDGQNQLLSLLQESIIDLSAQAFKINELFYLPNTKGEIQRAKVKGNETIAIEKLEEIIWEWEDPLRLPLVINTAIAALERVRWENYRRYCLQQLQYLCLSQESERQEYYYQEFRAAIEQIEELDRQRLAPSKNNG